MIDCCNLPKTRGPNTVGEMVCPVHCSKCGHDRKEENHIDICVACVVEGGPCGLEVGGNEKDAVRHNVFEEASKKLMEE